MIIDNICLLIQWISLIYFQKLLISEKPHNWYDTLAFTGVLLRIVALGYEGTHTKFNFSNSVSFKALAIPALVYVSVLLFQLVTVWLSSTIKRAYKEPWLKATIGCTACHMLFEFRMRGTYSVAPWWMRLMIVFFIGVNFASGIVFSIHSANSRKLAPEQVKLMGSERF